MAFQDLSAKPPLAATPEPVQAPTVDFSDTSSPIRLGLWVLAIGFGGFLAWAALAPLDEGVPAQGLVTIAAKRKTVQHLSGGLINKIYVKEGQFVNKDDPLIALDDASLRGNYEEIRYRYLTLRASEDRLVAEQTQKATVSFHADLVNQQDDPQIKQIMTNQENLFRARRNAMQTDMQAAQDVIKGLQAMIQGAERVRASRSDQLQSVEDELKSIRDMVREGYVPRTRQRDLERMASDALGAIAESHSNALRGAEQIAETRSRAAQRVQEYRKEVDSMLADVRREVQPFEQKLNAASAELKRMVVTAPASGQVVGLMEQTEGGVIPPGVKLMDIVPQNEALIIDARIPTNLIDRIQQGLKTDVRFSAFAHNPSLVVKGLVTSISSDTLTDARTGAAYYLGRVEITPEGMAQLGQNQMQPGMPVEVVFQTGERTLLTYLLHPFLKRLAVSLKEQ